MSTKSSSTLDDIHPKVPHGIPSREPVDERASRPARSGRR
jgi:hypothetical protein